MFLFYVGSSADGALILPPSPLLLSLSLSIRAPFYGYLKLLKGTRKENKLKEGFVVAAGKRTRNLPNRRSRTNYNQLRQSFHLNKRGIIITLCDRLQGNITIETSK